MTCLDLSPRLFLLLYVIVFAVVWNAGMVAAVGMPMPHIYSSYFDGSATTARPEQEQIRPDLTVQEIKEESQSHNLTEHEQMEDETTEELESILNETTSYPVPYSSSQSPDNSSAPDVLEYLSRLEQRLAMVEELYRKEKQQQLIPSSKQRRRSLALEGLRLFFVSALPLLSWGALLGISFVCAFHLLVFLLDFCQPGIDIVRNELHLMRLRAARFVVKVLKDAKSS